MASSDPQVLFFQTWNARPEQERTPKSAPSLNSVCWYETLMKASEQWGFPYCHICNRAWTIVWPVIASLATTQRHPIYFRVLFSVVNRLHLNYELRKSGKRIIEYERWMKKHRKACVMRRISLTVHLPQEIDYYDSEVGVGLLRNLAVFI